MNMTEVEMLTTMPVSPDGLRVETWISGSIHKVSDDLLRGLIDAGAVALVERKAEMAAPENKALGAAPKRKRKRK
ncbi:MAG: hypothetical protein ACPG4X_21565 [Pikeienuella sp.]